MPKRWIMIGLVAAMIATLVSTALVAVAAPSSQDAGGNSDPQPQDEGPDFRRAGAASLTLVGWINQSLSSAPFWRQFDRFLGAEFRFLGPEDTPATAVAIPGTVIETGEDFVIIDANDGTGPQRYVFESPIAPPIQLVLGRLEPGGNVIVVTVDGDARWLVVARQPCREDDPQGPPFGQQDRPDGQAPPTGQGRFGQGGRFGQLELPDGQDRPAGQGRFGQGGRFGQLELPDGQDRPAGQGRFGQGGRFGQQDGPDSQAPPVGQGRFGQGGRFGQQDRPEGQSRFEGFQRPGQSDAGQNFGQFVRCNTPDRPEGQERPQGQGTFEGFRRSGQADGDQLIGQGRFGRQGQDGESARSRTRSQFGFGGDGDEFRQRLLDRIQELRISVSALFEDE